MQVSLLIEPNRVGFQTVFGNYAIKHYKFNNKEEVTRYIFFNQMTIEIHFYITVMCVEMASIQRYIVPSRTKEQKQNNNLLSRANPNIKCPKQ